MCRRPDACRLTRHSCGQRDYPHSSSGMPDRLPQCHAIKALPVVVLPRHVGFGVTSRRHHQAPSWLLTGTIRFRAPPLFSVHQDVRCRVASELNKTAVGILIFLSSSNWAAAAADADMAPAGHRNRWPSWQWQEAEGVTTSGGNLVGQNHELWRAHGV